MCLNENVNITEVGFLCKDKCGVKKMSFGKFDDVLMSIIADLKNNESKLVFNLTDIDTIQDIHQQELPPLTDTACLIQQEREKNKENL